MDFTLDKKHEMARGLFRDFAETEVNLLHRRQMRQSSSRLKLLQRWQNTDSWEFRFQRSTADRDVIL